MVARRSYHQFCGLAAALDVVGERWSLLVVRELEPGPRRFTDLFDGLPGISTDMLAERLRQLEHAGAVARTEIRHPVPAKRYELTERGRALAEIAAALAMWGAALLHSPPDAGVHLRAKWALQTMVHRYAGGLDDGGYELSIDGEMFTVVVQDGTAMLRYGPGDTTVRLHIACTTEAFFAMVTERATDGIDVLVGTTAMLRRFLSRLPLLLGDLAPERQRTSPAR